MAQLRQDYEQFVVRQADILVVSPEDAEEVRRYWEREKLPMVGLADPGHEVANQYGQQVKLLKFGRLPALAIVDRSGQIRYQHHGSGMQDIPHNSQVLRLLDRLNSDWTEQAETREAQRTT